MIEIAAGILSTSTERRERNLPGFLTNVGSKNSTLRPDLLHSILAAACLEDWYITKNTLKSFMLHN